MYPIIGERIRLRLQGGEPVQARVDLRVGRRCEVTLPSGPLRPAELAPGRPFELWLSRNDAAYVHRGSVLEETDAGRAVLLLNEDTPERLQRREYFRLKVRLPILLRIPGQEPDSSESGAAQSRWLLFPVRDLSGGGCLCLDPDELITIGNLYEARFKTEPHQSPLSFTLRAVRRTTVRNLPAAGFEFVALPEKDRARIMAALFSEYRRIRTRILQGR